MELLIYGLALGFSAAILVPIVAGLSAKVLPTSISQNVSVPTSYPTTGAGILWSILFWGLFLGLSLWAVSLIGPVGRAVRSEA